MQKPACCRLHFYFYAQLDKPKSYYNDKVVISFPLSCHIYIIYYLLYQ